jgi:branched-chain amino acid transport system substrate-binding protein
MVPPGPRIVVGPENVNGAFDALASGGNIDFDGASGPLDFDVTTGEAEGDVQVWCIDVDGSGRAVGFKDSGRYYSAVAKRLEGNFDCP